MPPTADSNSVLVSYSGGSLIHILSEFPVIPVSFSSVWPSVWSNVLHPLFYVQNCYDFDDKYNYWLLSDSADVYVGHLEDRRCLSGNIALYGYDKFYNRLDVAGVVDDNLQLVALVCVGSIQYVDACLASYYDWIASTNVPACPRHCYTQTNEYCSGAVYQGGCVPEKYVLYENVYVGHVTKYRVCECNPELYRRYYAGSVYRKGGAYVEGGFYNYSGGFIIYRE